MKQPSSKVLNYFSLQGPFTTAINGDSAQTFLSECFVVQARPEDWLDCGNLLYQTSQTLLLPGLDFTAKPFLYNKRVWTVQRRLPVVSETTWPPIGDEKFVDRALSITGPVLAQLDYLARCGPFDKVAALPAQPITKIQRLTVTELKEKSAQACPIRKDPAQNLPNDEPESALVLSHGDPIIKNTLLTPLGPVLIDFEAIAILPRHSDLTHMAAVLLKRTPYQFWDKIITSLWSLARERLPGWDAKDWRLSVTVYLLREVLYFPLADEKANLAVWSGLGQLIANN